MFEVNPNIKVRQNDSHSENKNFDEMFETMENLFDNVNDMFENRICEEINRNSK